MVGDLFPRFLPRCTHLLGAFPSSLFICQTSGSATNVELNAPYFFVGRQDKLKVIIELWRVSLWAIHHNFLSEITAEYGVGIAFSSTTMNPKRVSSCLR